MSVICWSLSGLLLEPCRSSYCGVGRSAICGGIRRVRIWADCGRSQDERWWRLWLSTTWVPHWPSLHVGGLSSVFNRHGALDNCVSALNSSQDRRGFANYRGLTWGVVRFVVLAIREKVWGILGTLPFKPSTWVLAPCSEHINLVLNLPWPILFQLLNFFSLY